jgi:hypothetical protein
MSPRCFEFQFHPRPDSVQYEWHPKGSKFRFREGVIEGREHRGVKWSEWVTTRGERTVNVDAVESWEAGTVSCQPI